MKSLLCPVFLEAEAPKKDSKNLTLRITVLDTGIEALFKPALGKNIAKSTIHVWKVINKHCQRHNGPENRIHIKSSTQILIKLKGLATNC